jgi:hypothetical protein
LSDELIDANFVLSFAPSPFMAGMIASASGDQANNSRGSVRQPAIAALVESGSAEFTAD